MVKWSILHNLLIESGLESAIKCTQALFLGDRESLAKMTEEEINATFKGRSTVTLPMSPGKTL